MAREMQADTALEFMKKGVLSCPDSHLVSMMIDFAVNKYEDEVIVRFSSNFHCIYSYVSNPFRMTDSENVPRIF